jgi:hypothetical protein
MLDDIILGTHRFHLPLPACLAKATEQPEEREDEINGVARRAMQVEFCLPHTTFLNVDDVTVDVEAEMAKKAAVVLAKRKKDAEKLAETRHSSKRAMDDARNVRTGNARGYGSKEGDRGVSGRVDKVPEAEEDAGAEMDPEREGEAPEKRMEKGNEHEEEEEEEEGEEDEQAEEDGRFSAFAVRGIGTNVEEKVYVVWNNPDPSDPGTCEVSWSPTRLIRNFTQMFPRSTLTSLKRTDLKFGSELVGRSITGTFKCMEEDGGVTTMDEDGVIERYDEESSMHVVQWDGGVNVHPTQVGKGDKIKHNLMLTGKTNKTYHRGRWDTTREILIKWYLDEEDEPYPPKNDD